MWLKTLLFCGLGVSYLQAEIKDQKTFVTAVQKYCVECHGPEKQKGDRRYDQLALPIANEDTLIDLQDMMDQLNLNEMPPKKAKEHPSDQLRMDLIAYINKEVTTYHQKDREASAKVSLRRLNQREYINSLRDLFNLNMSMFNPTIGFPSDQLSEHMDNIGQKLVTSGFLLDKIIESADTVVEKAMMPRTKPEEKELIFKGKFASGPEMRRAFKVAHNNKYLVLYEQNQSSPVEAAYGYLDELKEGVPADGIYEIKVLAQAHNRNHPYKPEDLGMSGRPAFRLGIVPGKITYGDLHHPQPEETQLAEIELKDGEPQWYTVKVYLDKGYTPRFTFPNGIYNIRPLHGKLIKNYPELFPGIKSTGIVKNRVNLVTSDTLPQIRLHEVRVKGPLHEIWPPKPQQTVLAGKRFELSHVYDLIKSFATKAYRRPVSETEMNLLMQIVDGQKQLGKSSYFAFKDGLKAVLSSPNFLYLNPIHKNDVVLKNYAIATRLSYFLWSSIPDQELMQLAESKKLTDKHVRSQQMKRMIKDPKAEAFIQGFLDSWLNLRALEEIQPDRKKFERYYARRLGEAMRTETQLFTEHILKNNKSVLDFLFSDYSFINKDLASIYGEEVSLDHNFKKVKLTKAIRGGLLGQASILKVTANGIDTSPVVRGSWVLDNLLGTPAPLPPPDVEPLDPDTRGAKNIRDQLRKHRESPTCYDCHQKIDPIGFALENYDAIGVWRNYYDSKGKIKIDASGEMSDGKKFNNVVGFKKTLHSKETFFVRHLTGKLMSYALGKHLEARDRFEIENIVKEAKKSGYGFQDILTLIVSSKMFETN